MYLHYYTQIFGISQRQIDRSHSKATNMFSNRTIFRDSICYEID